MREVSEKTDRPSPVGCIPTVTRCIAVQLTRSNRVSVIGWIQKRGGSAGISRDGIMLWVSSRPRHMFLDDWVVHTPTGAFLVVPKEEFEQTFERTSGPLPRRRRKLTA